VKAWPKVRLDDCSRIVAGATPSTSVDEYWNGDICWATPKDLSNLESPYLDDTPRKITQSGLENCAAEILPVNSVLFSSRAPIGLVAINRVPTATNQGFKNFIPDTSKLLPEFLFHWLRAKRAYLDNLGNGATFKEVSKATVSRIEIELPTVAEQKKIATILDAGEALQAKRKQALAKLDTLTKSLFIDLFGDPSTNPKDWPIRNIGELLESATYGTSEKSEMIGEFPVLRMNNITRTGEMDFTDLKFMNLDASLYDRYLVRAGDILFNRTNSAELVGKTGIFREAKPMAYAGYLIRLRVTQDNDPEFLAAFLNSGYSKKVLRHMCKSIIGMANINATEIQAMKIPQPPLSLQQEFARQVTVLQKLKAVQHLSLSKLNTLFASLQSRAFKGEL
jgi:type I restriction enzyme S subunit